MSNCMCGHRKDEHNDPSVDDEHGTICWVTYCECPSYVEYGEERNDD